MSDSDDDDPVLEEMKILERFYRKNYIATKGVDEKFSTITLNELDTGALSDALKSNDFINILKPYIFDCLKRFHRITPIRDLLIENLTENDDYKIEERHLIYSTIYYLNQESKSRFGKLLAKNDYPLPLMFTIYKNETLQNQVEFDTLNYILGLTNKPLAVISGTKHAVNKGKSSLIPHIFHGLHEEKSVFKSKGCNFIRKNNVDVICNDETCSDWVIADFHSEVETDEAKNLLKAFGVYASLHIVNATMDDVDKNGEFSNEIKSILDWYAPFEIKPLVIIVIRDFEQKQKDKFKKISNNFQVFKFECFVNANDGILKKNKTVVKDIASIISNLEKKPMHSIHDIKRFYESLQNNNMNRIYNKTTEHKLETKLNNLFKNYCSDSKSIFRIAEINEKIKELQDEIEKMGYDDNKRPAKESQLLELNKQLMNVNPFTDHLNFFREIVLSKDFLSNIVIFENYLVDFKKDKLKELRTQKIERKKSSEDFNKNLQDKQSELNELEKSKKESREKELKRIDDQIEFLDLTVDKFWDEIFSIYDWIMKVEKENSQALDESLESQIYAFKRDFEKLIDRYINLLEYGFAIHILRGRPLKIESKALELVFQKLQNNKELYIITVIGEQSSAKSYLLNSLFGCDFRTSAGRCTVGIYMSFVNYKDKKIVILDTEGLMSVESGNVTFDNQLATMAVLSSHMVIINHKGEISSNLERLLGITFYAKLRTTSLIFKPLLCFVLRDQTDRNDSSIRTQVVKLQNKLDEQASRVEHNIDDVMSIAKDVKLLPNAFTEGLNSLTKIQFKSLNELFPTEILDLRKDLIQKLENMDKRGHAYENLNEFYNSMCIFWTTLEDLGTGILNCKSLEELKVRNEIAVRYLNVISKFDTSLSKDFYETIIEIQKHHSTSKTDEFNSFLDTHHQTIETEAIAVFKKSTSASYFPEEIKHEYEQQIKRQLNRTKCIFRTSFEIYLSDIEAKQQLLKLREEMTEDASNILKTTNDTEILRTKLKEKLNTYDLKYSTFIKSIYEEDKTFAKKIENCYNSNHRQYIFGFNQFEVMPQINNFEEFIGNKPNEIGWIRESIKQKNTNEIFKTDEDCIKWIKNEIDEKIIPQTIDCIKRPFVEDSHIRNVFDSIKIYLFSLESPIVRFEQHFNIQKLLIDVFKIVLKGMNKTYVNIKKEQLESMKKEYDDLKKQLIDAFKTDIENMANVGMEFANNLIINIKLLLFEKIKKRVEISIFNYIRENFKNPEDLLELAYKKSFVEGDYEAVYKYVKNVRKYCLEVSKRSTEHRLDAIVGSEINNLMKEFNNIKAFFLNSNFFVDGITTIHEFLEKQIQIPNAGDIKCFLEELKPLIIDMNISDVKLFINSFQTEIKSSSPFDEEKLSEILNKKAIDSNNEYLKELIGCTSTCPGCRSKCCLEIGHEGPHKSNKHILVAFNGWKNIQENTIHTVFCWENTFLKDSQIHIVTDGNKKTFDSFEKYVEKYHRNWLDDMRQNYRKYILNGFEKKLFQDLRYYMQRAWINVRQPILFEYKLKDKKYHDAWLRMEDKKKCLKKDFTIKGYTDKNKMKRVFAAV